MPTDNERREVARRLRHSWANVPDKNPVMHQLRVLFEIYSAVGLADDDDADAIDLFDRLADLIEPSGHECVPGECPINVRHDNDKIDRDALLALADELEEDACWEVQTPGDTSGAWRLKDACDRIREALGVSDG